MKKKIKAQKDKTLIGFKAFLALNCWDLKKYGQGKYDKIIYEFFLPVKKAKLGRKQIIR